MSRLFRIAPIVCLLVAFNTLSAEVIADFSEDFGARKDKQKAGWSYQWNPTGVSVDDQKGYQELQEHGPKRKRVIDAADLPGKDCKVPNGKFLEMKKGYIRPGTSASTATDELSHYGIACYTVQPGEAGEGRIVESSIKRNGSGEASADLRIYVNDRLVGSEIFTDVGSYSFNVSLAALAEGDTVYVAYGIVKGKALATSISYQIETN